MNLGDELLNDSSTFHRSQHTDPIISSPLAIRDQSILAKELTPRSAHMNPLDTPGPFHIYL